MLPRSGFRIPSTHSIVVVLPAPFGPDQPEDLAVADLERHVVDGDGLLVGLADASDADDRRGHVPS